MHIKNGWLYLNKTERKEIETVLRHCEEDIAYQSEGTFCKIDRRGEHEFDDKEAGKAMSGIENIRWILKTYLD